MSGLDLALGRGGDTNNSDYVSSTVPVVPLNVTAAGSTGICSSSLRKCCRSLISLVSERSQGWDRYLVPLGVGVVLLPLLCPPSVAGAWTSLLSSSQTSADQ